MRWQRYSREEWNISENLDDYSLEQLFEMSKRAKEYFFDIRDSEPSSKDKDEEIYKVWNAQCQQVIKDLNEILLAIDKRYDKPGESFVSFGNTGMTYEDLMKEIELNRAMREAYRRGDIEDGMSDECRQNWTDKCNS